MSKDIYETILKGGEAALAQLIEDGQPEDLQIDFKEKSDAGRSRPGTDDKKNLGKALSGFSNSLGGLLVWGIKTGKGSELDVAEELKPIADIDKFSAHIKKLIPGYLSPPNDDVHVDSVPAKSGGGYLLVWVGQSDRRPHMSGQDHRYYRRTGDSFMMLEHYEVEDLFNVRSGASLELFHEIIDRGGSSGAQGQRKNFLVKVGLRNDSLISARFPFLRVTDLAPLSFWEFGVDGNRNFGLPQRSGVVSGGHLFAGGADDIIHPGQQILVAAIPVAWDIGNQHWIPPEIEPGKGIKFSYDLGCDGGHTVSGAYEITHRELRRALGAHV